MTEKTVGGSIISAICIVMATVIFSIAVYTDIAEHNTPEATYFLLMAIYFRMIAR